MINTILFDLDGTLLPLDMDKFLKIYFEEMGHHFKDVIHPKELIKHMWASTEIMVANLEDKINEDVFMGDFGKRIASDLELYKKGFDEFYDNGFLKAKESSFESKAMRDSIKLLKDRKYDLVIATNPIFPLKAILHRINWAGFKQEDFIYISSYERNHYCKPQVHFYEEVLRDIHKTSEECLMVGNDVQEDLVASKAGIKTFLIEDNIINRSENQVICDYKGSYKDFYNFVENLPDLKNF